MAKVYKNDLQELYHKFDCTGTAGDQHLAWYGQERAKGHSHSEAIALTYEKYERWCKEVWPKRKILLPGQQQCNYDGCEKEGDNKEERKSGRVVRTSYWCDQHYLLLEGK